MGYFMQPLSATPAIPHQSHFWFLTPTENILLPSTQNSVLLLPYPTNYLLPCKKSYSILQKSITVPPPFLVPSPKFVATPKKCFVTLQFFSCAPTAKNWMPTTLTQMVCCSIPDCPKIICHLSICAAPLNFLLPSKHFGHSHRYIIMFATQKFLTVFKNFCYLKCIASSPI